MKYVLELGSNPRLHLEETCIANFNPEWELWYMTTHNITQ